MKQQRLFSILILFAFTLIFATGCTSNQEQTTERTQAVNIEENASDTTLSTDGDWDDDDQSHINNQNSTSANMLSEQEVRNIVEKYTADLKGKDFIIKPDTEDGIQIYEVEGTTSTHEYEFEIHASTGKILSYKKELLHTNTQKNQSKNTLSEQEVRNIVEKNTNALKGKNLEIERDSDDGLKIYEVEGKTSTHKYEFEINACTGEIISYEEKLRD